MLSQSHLTPHQRLLFVRQRAAGETAFIVTASVVSIAVVRAASLSARCQLAHYTKNVRRSTTHDKISLLPTQAVGFVLYSGLVYVGVKRKTETELRKLHDSVRRDGVGASHHPDTFLYT